MRVPMNVDGGRHLNASGDGVAENTIACVQKAHSRLAHARGRVALAHGMALVWVAGRVVVVARGLAAAASVTSSEG